MPICGGCGQENPEIARFCLGCGHAREAAPHREERRVVSVLFVDLVGFTSRAEQLDPEDVRAILRRTTSGCGRDRALGGRWRSSSATR